MSEENFVLLEATSENSAKNFDFEVSEVRNSNTTVNWFFI